MAMPRASGYVSQSRRWLGPMAKRLRQGLVILAVLLVVMAILFVIVYGVGIHHHHSNTNHGAIATFTTVA